MPYVNLPHGASYQILSIFLGFGKESISSLFLLFQSLQKHSSIQIFIIFLFEIRAQVSLDPFKHFINFIILQPMAGICIMYYIISLWFSEPIVHSQETRQSLKPQTGTHIYITPQELIYQYIQCSSAKRSLSYGIAISRE